MSFNKRSTNKEKSNRQYAAYMARKFFSGQLHKYNVIDSFPDDSNDIKIRALYERIMKTPKRGWLFVVSKRKYQEYILKSYELIEELESENNDD